MKYLVTILFFTLLSYNTSYAQKYTEKYIEEAKETSKEWWKYINNQNFKEAYNELDKTIKNQYTKEQWEAQMLSLIEEIGKIQNRNITNTNFQSEIDGLENGFYVIINYDSDYSKTRNHRESLLLKQNDQFKWKILSFDWEFQLRESNLNEQTN